MRYLRYLLEKGTFEVTVILVLPSQAFSKTDEYFATNRDLTIADDLDVFAELTSLAIDLDAVVEEFFEVGTVEDTVGSGLRVVDDKLVLGRGGLGGGGFGGLFKGEGH